MDIILQYLKEFLSDDDTSWDDEHVPEQARSLFTSWCLLNNILPDTYQCDRELTALYESGYIHEYNVTFDDFRKYMIEYLV